MTNFTAERQVPLYNINGYEVGYTILYGSRAVPNISISDNLNVTTELLIKNQNGDFVPYCLLLQDSLGINAYITDTVLNTNEIYIVADDKITAIDNVSREDYKSTINYANFYKNGKPYKFITNENMQNGILVSDGDNLKVSILLSKDFEGHLAHQHTHEENESSEGVASEDSIIEEKDALLKAMENDELIAVMHGDNGVLYNSRTDQILVLDNEARTYKEISDAEARDSLGVDDFIIVNKHEVLTKYLDDLKTDTINFRAYQSATLKAMPEYSNFNLNNATIYGILFCAAIVPMLVLAKVKNMVIKSQDSDGGDNDEHK